MRNLISHTVPVSMHTTVNGPIQLHTAVHCNSWLRWTAMYPSPQQTVTHFYSSELRPPFRSQVQFVFCGCFVCAFNWVWWKCQKRNNLIFIGLGNVNLILLTERQEEYIMLKLKWLIKKSNTQTVLISHIIYLPSYLSFNYQAIYRSKSLSRYCS